MTAISKKKSVPTNTVSQTPTLASKGSSEKTANIDTTQRQNMIAEAAYYIAQENGFEGSSMQDDWLAAEQEINAAWPNAE